MVKIGSLGNIAISNFTDTPRKGKKYPLELIYCKECTLLQLAHNTPKNLLYEDYWYQSHLNPVIVEDLKEIAKYGRGVHYDIGGNDGTLLRYSKARVKCSIDPSNIKPAGFDWIQDYWENTNYIIPNNSGDVITAIACIYDLPNPNKFMKNIKKVLTTDGIFIAQLMTLQPFIENNDVGNICHEHLEYYSYKSLVRLYEQNGLEIFKVEKNKINGGSYRIFARHFKKGSIKFKEKEYTLQDFKDFFKRIEENKREITMFLYKNLSVYGYGASTKANTILQYYDICGFNTLGGGLKGIIDINPQKKGKYTISTKLPIIDKIPKDCQYLWVFPYGFIDYFKKKEKGYKGKWITTIPEFKIL